MTKKKKKKRSLLAKTQRVQWVPEIIATLAEVRERIEGKTTKKRKRERERVPWSAAQRKDTEAWARGMPIGNQPWLLIGRTDAEAEAPILWPPNAKNWDDSLEKTLMLGEIEGRGRTGRQRMRWLDGITDSMGVNLRFEQTLGDSEGQGGLACCSPWSDKESDVT